MNQEHQHRVPHRSLMQIIGVALCCGILTVGGPAFAETAGEAVHDTGHDIGNAARTVGHKTAEAARSVGHATKHVAKKVGHATRHATKAVGHGVKNVVHGKPPSDGAPPKP